MKPCKPLAWRSSRWLGPPPIAGGRFTSHGDGPTPGKSRKSAAV
jgi:hypothetical protein